MMAQLTLPVVLHPARQRPAECLYQAEGMTSMAWRMKAFRFACRAGLIEIMSRHIISMRASPIQRSISAILDATNLIHTRTAFAHVPVLTCGGKLSKQDHASPVGRRVYASIRSFGRSISCLRPVHASKSGIVDAMAAISARVSPDNTNSRRDFCDSAMNAVCVLASAFGYLRQC
jgi:hypothetical protein